MNRRWSPGDVVSVKFNMTPQVVEANPRVVDDYGRAAVQRGPLVYCLEQLDQPEDAPLYDVSLDLRKKQSAQFHDEFQKDLLGGIVTLTHVGTASEKSGSGDKLYYRFSGSTTPVRPSGSQVHPLLCLGEPRRHTYAGLDADSSSRFQPSRHTRSR